MDVVLELTAEKRTFTVEIWYFDTVLEIKKKIQRHHNIPVEKQTLIFNGVTMEDSNDTVFYELLQDSRIQLLDQDEQHKPAEEPRTFPPATAAPEKMKVAVLPMNGKHKFQVEVNPMENVSEMRKELQRLQVQGILHLPEDGYFFIFKQNVMDEDRSFRWHQVRQADTIEIFHGSVTGGGS